MEILWLNKEMIERKAMDLSTIFLQNETFELMNITGF